LENPPGIFFALLVHFTAKRTQNLRGAYDLYFRALQKQKILWGKREMTVNFFLTCQ
jgi:hypothetical protein